MKLTAITLKGLEEVLAEELKELGAEDINILHRAVEFEGDKALMYKTNYRLRTALRVLKPIYNDTVSNEVDLYKMIYSIPWEDYMSIDQTFAIDSAVSSAIFTHSKYVSLKSKDALVDRWRDKQGKRPNVNTLNPDLKVHIRIFNKELIVSLDSSSESLHRRGNRMHSVDAPINEVLAAGLIMLSGWDKKQTFLDPMSGSGTIVMEAYSYARGLAPQSKDREFGFKRWQDFDQDLWDSVTLDQPLADAPKMIARDRNLRSIKATEMNIAHVGWLDDILVEKQDFFKSKGTEPYHMLFNPPYDERLKEKNISEFYSKIGDTLKQSYAGSTAWMIAGNEEALKKIGLRPSRKISLMNGPIPSKFCKFEMYQGSKKAKYQK